ncbi:tetratricopeptide repeat protein [Dyadobacter aurulentus]|uniref:tetratricopeptide repeat protein n=1 Tax=Dyadobacter sp. UC 10 TaxID=2605428 RepID=UPI0011F0CDB0|nr:hypothetical protein [Dyadobacter sp. UC 10]KAA0989122.1 hypothetical protein FXO21_02550 [Dyadobacter sp. UC 10]
MLEVLVVITFFGYIYYLRNYADLRSKSEREESEFAAGIEMYRDQNFEGAFRYCNDQVVKNRRSSIAHLYRGLAQKGLKNRKEAYEAVQTAVSLDDDVYEAHLELGRLFLEDGDPKTALLHFTKSVSKAQGTSPKPYHWRSQAYVALQMEAEAQADLVEERLISDKSANQQNTPEPIQAPFVDKKLIASLVMVVFTGVLLTVVVKRAESVHLPYLVAVCAAIAIGFAEPRKGWFLALVQCMLVLGGYFLFTELPETSSETELENFSLYGSLILTFVASFLGGFMKRALSMD